MKKENEGKIFAFLPKDEKDEIRSLRPCDRELYCGGWHVDDEEEIDYGAAYRPKPKPDMEIDWSKVPAWQPVLVRDRDSDDWKRSFFGKPGYAKPIYDGWPFSWRQMKLDPDAKPIFSWKPWRGGECPVDGGVLVHVVCRGGYRNTRAGSFFRWNHENKDSDIIWYAVAQPDADSWPGV